MATRSERKERGRVDILQAAAGLFAVRGYHGMSMRALQQATGMSLANLYNYFASKEDVLFALQTRAFETLIASAEEAVEDTREPAERLHAFILNHVRYVVDHRDVLRVLVEEAGELPAERRRAVRALKVRYFRVGQRLVRALAGRRRGAAGAAELERFTFSVFGMLNWVYAWYTPARHGSAREVARTIHRIATSGLAAGAGRRPGRSSLERRLQSRALRSLVAARAFPLPPKEA